MVKTNYYIKIHGHSCLEFRSESTIILFDPWLCGSAYWRSWWNFPEPSSLEKIIKDISNCKNIYLYITFTLGSFSWSNFKEFIQKYS